MTGRRGDQPRRVVIVAPAVVIALLAAVGWRAAVIEREPWQPPVTHTIDLNTATRAELRLLPGIGPALAERIEQDRAERGGFASVEDLARVRGIGPRTVLEIRQFARVGHEAPGTGHWVVGVD